MAVGSNFYRPGRRLLRARIAQILRNRKVRRYRPDLFLFDQRFARFVEANQSNNLRYILYNICGNNPDELAKLCPPDYLPRIFQLFAQRQEQHPPRHEADFSLAVLERQEMVSFYNDDYVQDPLRRLRRDQLLTKLPENYRLDAERKIEDFRDRWVRFLDDFQQFLEKLNNDFGYGPSEGFRAYFDRPQKL